MSRIPPVVLSLALVFLLTARGSSAIADEGGIFEKPVPLEADGKVIDTGAAWGHSGPCLADVDGDSVRDLVVGDFSGRFRVYRNLGRDDRPKFGPETYLMAGGTLAKVPIYCCIGSSPQLVDFDGDGKPDLISGSYDPGECYLFRGSAKENSRPEKPSSIRPASRSCAIPSSNKITNRLAVGR